MSKNKKVNKNVLKNAVFIVKSISVTNPKKTAKSYLVDDSIASKSLGKFFWSSHCEVLAVTL